MKQAFILLFILCGISLNGARYYVATTGSDSNDGSTDKPYLTIRHAAAVRTASGDSIIVRTGTYYVTGQISLAVGVSLIGEGSDSTIIRSNTGGKRSTLLLYSGTLQSTGQSIAKLRLNGMSQAAFRAIYIHKRSNCRITDCTIEDFDDYAISIYGSGDYDTQADVFVQNTYIANNRINNCSAMNGTKYEGEGTGAITVDGTDGTVIENNEIDCSLRPNGLNGYCIKGVAGWNKGLKIRSNTLIREAVTRNNQSLIYDFNIELWNSLGGQEISYNTLYGGSVDISGGAGQEKGGWSYSNWIHHNFIGNYKLSDSNYTVGIFLETRQRDVIVEKNQITNVACGIYLPTYRDWKYGNYCSLNNIRISYNLMTNIGVNDDGDNRSGTGISFDLSRNTDTIRYLYIYNNTISGYSGAKTTDTGIEMPAIGFAGNIEVKNNIILGFDACPIRCSGTNGETMSNLTIDKNICWDNGNDNSTCISGVTLLNSTNNVPIKSDPLFYHDRYYEIQSTSPARDAGDDIGLTGDITGDSISGLPDIGCQEYVSPPRMTD